MNFEVCKMKTDDCQNQFKTPPLSRMRSNLAPGERLEGLGLGVLAVTACHIWYTGPPPDLGSQSLLLPATMKERPMASAKRTASLSLLLADALKSSEIENELGPHGPDGYFSCRWCTFAIIFCRPDSLRGVGSMVPILASIRSSSSRRLVTFVRSPRPRRSSGTERSAGRSWASSSSWMSLEASSLAELVSLFSCWSLRSVMLRIKWIFRIFRFTRVSTASFFLPFRSVHTPSARAEITPAALENAEIKLRLPNAHPARTSIPSIQLVDAAAMNLAALKNISITSLTTSEQAA